jgi:phosphomannomutase
MTTIKFGTSGWRAIMAEDFTFPNVRRVVDAVATYFGQQPQAKTAPIIVGYDSRFLSPEFAQETAALLATRGFAVLLSQEPLPTPVVSFQIRHQKALGGINFTASHNPAEYNGIKINGPEGAPATPDMTHEFERLANALPESYPPVNASEADLKRIKRFDPKPAYLNALKKVIDVRVLKKSRMKVGVDVLYGVGRGYLDTFLQMAGC